MIFNYFMRVIRSNLNNPRKMKMRGCFPRKCSFHRNANYLYFSLILRSKIDSNIFQNNFSLSSMFWNGDGIRWVIWPLIPDYPPHLKFNRYITTIKYFHLKYQFWEKLWTFFPLSNFYCLRSFEHAVFLAWPRVLSHWIHSLSQASFQVAVRGLMRELHTEKQFTHISQPDFWWVPYSSTSNFTPYIELKAYRCLPNHDLGVMLPHWVNQDV